MNNCCLFDVPCISFRLNIIIKWSDHLWKESDQLMGGFWCFFIFNFCSSFFLLSRVISFHSIQFGWSLLFFSNASLRSIHLTSLFNRYLTDLVKLCDKFVKNAFVVCCYCIRLEISFLIRFVICFCSILHNWCL